VETTPRTLLDALAHVGRVLLTGPVSPDGDSLGACLALQSILVARGVDCSIAGSPSYRYAWMPGIDSLIPESEVEPEWGAVVVLDGDRHRLAPEVERAFSAAPIRGIIDHHGSTQDDGYTHFWVAPEAGSTCEMLYAELAGWGVTIDRPMAEALYTGLIFDTGGFRYSNTSPASHEMAAALLRAGIDHSDICLRVLMDRRRSGLRITAEVFAQALFELDGRLSIGTVTLAQWDRMRGVDGDLEGIVECLVQVHGVEVGVLIIERPGGSAKLSLRSHGAVDVATVANDLAPSGGGHAKAAGVSLDDPIDVIVARVVTAIDAALSPSAR